MKEKIPPQTYTTAMQRLQEIAAELESGTIAIDDLESVIRESKELIAYCEQKLRTLETRIDGLDESKQ